MSLSAQDIVALAKAGYNAEQISFLNKEVLSTPSTEPSTQSTEPAPSTQPTEKQELSTPSTKPAEQQPTEPKEADPQPSVADLMEKLASLESKLTTQAINRDEQPAPEALTGERVLAQILDPRL